MYFLFFFLCIVVIKFTLNFLRYLATKVCLKKFNQNSQNTEQLIPFVETIFDSAKTNSLVLIESHSSTEYTKLSSLLCDSSCQSKLNSVFQQTIGVYKLRMLQSFNPFYWIFLPKYLFKSLEIQPSKPTLWLTTVLYWLLSTICTYLFDLYLDAHFSELFHNIIDMLP